MPTSLSNPAWRSVKIMFPVEILLTKRDVQLETCELSFIWGNMRTVVWKEASQITLRDCSKAAVGEGQ